MNPAFVGSTAHRPSSGGGGGGTKAYVPAPGVGTGDRELFVATTMNGSAAAWLVDGDTVTTGQGFFNGSAASGQTVQIDFGSGNSFVVTEFKWYQQTSDSHGVFQVQGSNDASSWTSIGSTFTLGGSATSTITTPSANTTAWRYYRLLGVSGTTSNNPWLFEIEIQTLQ